MQAQDGQQTGKDMAGVRGVPRGRATGPGGGKRGIAPWLAMAVALAIAPAFARAQLLAIVDARIIASPEAEPIERGTLLLRDGRIEAVGTSVAIPAEAGRIDAGGATVVAGYWNSHIHLMAAPLADAASRPAAELSQALAEQYLRWGFTTVFDIGSKPGNAFALRERIAAGEVTGPRVMTVDAPFFPEHGTPIYVLEFEGFGEQARAFEVATPAQAGERAQRQLTQGADGVKIFAGAILGGAGEVLPMDVDVARAAIAPAHAAGKPAFAHPTNLAGLRVSIDSGVDVLSHVAPTAGPWPPELVRELVERRVALVPTLTLFEVELRKDGVPEEVVARVVAVGQRQLADFAAAGGVVLFGTDAGYTDRYDTRDELRLMAGAGLDWRQILASLTTAPAARIGGGTQSARLAPGQAADLVLLDGDPTRDVVAFASVRQVLRAGRPVYTAPSFAGERAPRRSAR